MTRKYFAYLQFRKVWYILEDKNINTEQKNKAIENLLNLSLSNNCISPAIAHLNDKSSSETIKSIVSIYWLIGFIEGQRGNFNILYEQAGEVGSCFDIEFSIRIKREENLLYLIKRLFRIPNKITVEQDGYFLLKTKQARALSNIIDRFSIINGSKFKGMKSLYFKLWKKAFFYKNVNTNKVKKIYKILSKLYKKNMIS